MVSADDAAPTHSPDGQRLAEDDDVSPTALKHRFHAHAEQGRHRGGGEPLGVDLDGVGNAYPQHAGKQQRHHGRRQVGQRQARRRGPPVPTGYRYRGTPPLSEGRGAHVGENRLPHQDMQGEATAGVWPYDGGIVHVQ
ncbi:MAG: hypothetical protein ACLU38_01220 [Dysosmobacter sp.]